MMVIKRCSICGKEILGKKYICDDCKVSLDNERIDSFLVRCEKCHYPKLSDDYECTWCKKEYSFPVYSISSYSGSFTNDVLQQFKFQGNKDIARVVALCIEKGLDVIDPEGNSIIVPVPCSPASLKRRGWDQMDVVCSYLKRPVKHLISNVQNNSAQQKRLSRSQRLRSVKGKYELCASEDDVADFKDRKVIIVDDIMTTGSTLVECRSLLLSAGFVDVEALTWLNEIYAGDVIG